MNIVRTSVRFSNICFMLVVLFLVAPWATRNAHSQHVPRPIREFEGRLSSVSDPETRENIAMFFRRERGRLAQVNPEAIESIIAQWESEAPSGYALSASSVKATHAVASQSAPRAGRFSDSGSSTQGTHVSGQLQGSLTWSRESSPYIVDANVTVQAGAKLTIEPGVEVKFASSTGLFIEGCLVARGTSSDRVLFTSLAETPVGGDWKGIRFSDSSENAQYDANDVWIGGCILENSLVEFAQRGVTVAKAAPFLRFCRIANCLYYVSAFAPGGAGIFVEASDPGLSVRIADCEIVDNAAGGGAFGGGVDVRGSAILQRCTISGNRVTSANGGGIYAKLASGELTVEDCEIADNEASDGGGIEIDSGGLSGVVLRGCDIHDNWAFSGGGIEIASGKSILIEKCCIHDNFAAHTNGWGQRGGGVNIGYKCDLRSCVIENNFCVWAGGGISVHATGVTIEKCIICGNVAPWGGGILQESETVSVSNCTLAGNIGYSGGGAYIGVVAGNAGAENWNGAHSTWDSCSIIDNDANLCGGLVIFEANTELVNCEVVANLGDDGALSCYGNDVRNDIINCTIADNVGYTLPSVGLSRATLVKGSIINSILAGHDDDYEVRVSSVAPSLTSTKLAFDPAGHLVVAMCLSLPNYHEGAALWRDMNNDLVTGLDEIWYGPRSFELALEGLGCDEMGRLTALYASDVFDGTPAEDLMLWHDYDGNGALDQTETRVIVKQGCFYVTDRSFRFSPAGTACVVFSPPSGGLQFWQDTDRDLEPDSGEIRTLVSSGKLRSMTLAFDATGHAAVAYWDNDAGKFCMWRDANGDYELNPAEVKVISEITTAPDDWSQGYPLAFDSANRACVAYLHAGGKELRFWHDVNGDGQADPSEIQVVATHPYEQEWPFCELLFDRDGHLILLYLWGNPVAYSSDDHSVHAWRDDNSDMLVSPDEVHVIKGFPFGGKSVHYLSAGLDISGHIAACVATSSSSVLSNATFWRDLNGNLTVDEGEAKLANCPIPDEYVVSHCCSPDVDLQGEGVVTADPGFVGPGDYRLAPNSPCIDSGTTDRAPSKDIRGIQRPQGAGVDIGAYERGPGDDEPSPTAIPDI